MKRTGLKRSVVAGLFIALALLFFGNLWVPLGSKMAFFVDSNKLSVELEGLRVPAGKQQKILGQIQGQEGLKLDETSFAFMNQVTALLGDIASQPTLDAAMDLRRLREHTYGELLLRLEAQTDLPVLALMMDLKLSDCMLNQGLEELYSLRSSARVSQFFLGFMSLFIALLAALLLYRKKFQAKN